MIRFSFSTLAALLLFPFATALHAQSVRQNHLYIDDGKGNFLVLNAPLGGGNITFPSSGTLMTNAGSGSLTLGGNLSTSGTLTTSGSTYNLQFNLNANTTLTLPTSGTLMTNPMMTLGDMIYGGTNGAPAQLLGNSTLSTKKFLTSTANSGVATAPAWGTIAASDLPVFVGEGATAAQGAVPSPGNSGTTTRFLREDGNWAAPSGGSSAVMVSGCSTSFSGGSSPTFTYPLGFSSSSTTTKADIADGDVMIIDRSGTIKNLTVTLESVPNSGKTYTFTLYDNGASTGVTVSLTNSTGATLTDNTDTHGVSAGDLISLHFNGTFEEPALNAAWVFDLQ